MDGDLLPVSGSARYYDSAAETRFLILQSILGHPVCLPSQKELYCVIETKSATEIDQEMARLVSAGYLQWYGVFIGYSDETRSQAFLGFTERGVNKLSEEGFLRLKSTAQSMYKHTEKTADVPCSELLARPDLPRYVAAKLNLD